MIMASIDFHGLRIACNPSTSHVHLMTPSTRFPAHSEPRVWVITAGGSPIGISVAKEVLAHGDYVIFGLSRTVENDEIVQCPRQAFDAFKEEVAAHSEEGWNRRLKAVALDIR